MALLESGAATEEDHRRLQQWRSSNGRHESTWQKAQQLRQRFASVPSELAMATLDRPDLARRAALKRALGIAALVPAGWLLTRQLPLAAWTADLHTATGERKRVALADGSSLLLSTDTAVNVDLAAGRLTLLRGEMALTVAERSTLTIASPYGQVLASGSDVCVRLNEHDCQVSVISGAVRVQPLSGAELLVVQGQQLRLQATGASAIGSFDVAQPGWRDGVLIAENQPLGDFLRELSRFRPGLLRWAPELEALRVTGSFQVDNTDQVLTLLAASLPVEVVSRTRYWVTVVPRKNSV
ncbi:sugar ABC transporter substrate-binding protein [Pseudomonas turukhanskensis]|uniref:Sugar ABC transporter substrate-binding protein n=1 Tax=Pseudomonas turukhanskensis TaxID=1806536 RepID=A0A9W6K4X7_9PSED|nr:sugar ABC transporter substrate-binding protein [Pseudomonas turukhanskensis]